MSHVEIYVPGIHLPEGLSEPREHLTLAMVLKEDFSYDTHPPGYYIMMLGWTKVFGTSITAIRLPSALLGTACIPLLFWLGALIEQRTAGWVAATLLAVHGHHILWSQVARTPVLTCFLGLLATILLVLIAKKNRMQPWLEFAYFATVLLGLTTHIFFWLILGSHILWTLSSAWSRSQPFPREGKIEILALILGSPLLALAGYQTGAVLSPLSGNVLIYAREFLQFAFMFPLSGFSSGADLVVPAIDNPHLSLARWLFFFLSLALLLLGVTSVRNSKQKLLSATGGPSSKSWMLAAGLGTIAILSFVYMAKAFRQTPEPHSTLRITEIMVVVPLLIAGLAILLQKNWGRLFTRPSFDRSNGILFGAQGLVLMLSVIPFVVLTVISRFKPIFNAKGMLLMGPYILLILAMGIVRVCRRYEFASVVLFILIGVTSYEGLKGHKQMIISDVDYKTFASNLAPYIQQADVLFVHRDWYVTPIFYYLNADQYHFVGGDYAKASRETPCSRVWVLLLGGEPREPIRKDMEEALSGYQVLQTIDDAREAKAVLYAPKNCTH